MQILTLIKGDRNIKLQKIKARKLKFSRLQEDLVLNKDET
jgi:hypothetical protein